uniref:Calponin-homology (CH) domain-containing protein n=1 Tax=Rodentolepis nana TaxID=102285 RepID=A0A0R3T5X9_RODNA
LISLLPARYHSSYLIRLLVVNLSIDYVSSPSLKARRLARQRISDSACRRYTQAILGQSEQSDLLASQSTKRSKHHNPPTRLISSSRQPSNFDLELPNLERSQPTLESMDTMTPEEKISTKRGEQDYVQKKTFTNWMNTYLTKANPQLRVKDLFEEIRDGIILIRLLEILSKETLPINITTDMKPAYCLSNVKTALDFLVKKKVKLVNINPVDIVDGRPKIVLGLIWVIILYFQIEEQEDMLLELLGIPKTGSRSKVTAKQALTTWVQNAFSEQFKIDIKDFGPSWRDGVAFNAIVHSIDPRLVDMREVERRTNRENLQSAFTVAEEKLGIPKILDPEDVDVEKPDEKSIMTYVAQFYKAFPETGKPKSLNLCDSETQRFTEFLDDLQNAESRLTESIQMNKNFNAAYPLDDLLQTIEQNKPDALADAQIEEMDNIAADFFLHHRTLSDQLKNLEQITAKKDKIEGLLSKIEDMIEHPPMDFTELEEGYNESFSDLTTSITELENLVRSAPLKIIVQDLDFSHFQRRKLEIVKSWKNLCSSRRLEIHALDDFEEAYGRVDALVIELARYFDAIESDLSSANSDLIKSGITMFEDLIDTLNNRLPNDMGNLKEIGKAIVESVSEGFNNEQLKKTCSKRLTLMESKLDDLINRKIAIEKICNKASVRLQGFKKFTEILESKVAEAKPKLALLKSGPKITGKSAKNDIDATNAWYAECENLENLFNSTQNAASKLQTLLEDLDFKSPPECSEIFNEYHRLRDESKVR